MSTANTWNNEDLPPLTSTAPHSPDPDFNSPKSSFPTFFIRFYQNYVLTNIGISLLVMSQLFNSLMILFCKLLLMDKDFDEPMNPLQIVFTRMVITYLGCIFYLYKEPDFPFGPKGLRWLMLGRGFGGFMGVFGQYSALVYLTVSDTIVITFLAPTFSSLAAYFVLKETYTRLEALCGAVAFSGVVLVARPSFLFGSVANLGASDAAADAARQVETFSSSLRLLGTFFALSSCCGTALAVCCMRKIGYQAHPLVTVSFYALVASICSFLGIIITPGMSFQIPNTLRQWLLLTAMGVTGFFMQYMFTMGMQREKASRGTTIMYTQMVYATFFDLIIFHHIPSLLSVLGSAVILSAVAVVVYFKPATTPGTGGSESADNTTRIALSDIESSPTSSSDAFTIDSFDFDIDAVRLEGVESK